MSEPAPAPAIDPSYLEAAGRYLMSLGIPRLKKFPVIDGGRRRFAERSPGQADLKIISKENS
jgi:hypothetical protein